MKRKQTKQRQWPHVYIRTQRSGQTSYVVDLGLVNQRRERHSFKTKGEAETFAGQKRTERTNQGVAALTLPQHLRVDAVHASAVLSPHGVSLLEAAKYYEKHVVVYRSAPTILEIVQRMLADAEKNGLRERSVGDLEVRLKMFADEFGQQLLSEITLEEIEDWLDEGDWSGRTRINYMTKLSQLYNFAIKRGWVDANLVARIDRPEVEDKEPGIFTVGQAEGLLSHAGKFGLLPYIAIGFFAGLRTAELLRIKWDAVKFEEKAIIVGAEIAKKRSRRVVEMHDALVAWLGDFGAAKGQVVDGVGFRQHLDELKITAKLEKWPHNGLRHSFASYHLAAFGDAVRTANMMGHRDSNVMHSHYKALVLKSEAEKFWALRPKK